MDRSKKIASMLLATSLAGTAGANISTGIKLTNFLNRTAKALAPVAKPFVAVAAFAASAFSLAKNKLNSAINWGTNKFKEVKSELAKNASESEEFTPLEKFFISLTAPALSHFNKMCREINWAKNKLSGKEEPEPLVEVTGNPFIDFDSRKIVIIDGPHKHEKEENNSSEIVKNKNIPELDLSNLFTEKRPYFSDFKNRNDNIGNLCKLLMTGNEILGIKGTTIFIKRDGLEKTIDGDGIQYLKKEKMEKSGELGIRCKISSISWPGVLHLEFFDKYVNSFGNELFIEESTNYVKNDLKSFIEFVNILLESAYKQEKTKWRLGVVEEESKIFLKNLDSGKKLEIDDFSNKWNLEKFLCEDSHEKE